MNATGRANVDLDIMTDSGKPQKKTKTELEELVKANGGKIYQMQNASAKTICIAERSWPFLPNYTDCN